MTKNAEVQIRCAIQKVSIQKYIIDTYSRLFVEEDDLQKDTQNKFNTPRNTVSPYKAVRKKEKKIRVTNADIARLKKKISNTWVKESDTKKRPHDESAIPSILRVFGSQKKRENKPYKDGAVAPHKKEYPTSFGNSISAISIPMGGRNKR